MENITGPVIKCQICKSKKLIPVLRYGNQPIVQAYLRPEQLTTQAEATYPLNLVYCAECGLLQLDYIVDPKIVFPKNYPYRTGLTNMLVRNFRSLTDLVVNKYNLKPGDLVIDIGSNDGTLLQGFKDKGIRVLGIEPTDAAKVANKNKIPTIQEFFNKKLVKKIIKKYGPAKLITATNVFAHINNLDELVSGIHSLLDKDGIFISESQYFMDTFEKLEFDCVYHEHIRFYTLKPLVKLLSKAGFTAADAERISAAGGSIRVFAMKGKHPQTARIKQLIQAEEKIGLYNPKKLKKFSERAVSAKRDIVSLVLECAKKGRVVGLGSPARANTLLNFTHLDKDILDYLVEKAGSPKIGLLTPGTHIPVMDENKIFKDQPEYLLILSWHIGEELMKKIRQIGYKGKFIMPLPKAKLVK
ncbi:MAG: class I SAM-dependent methyltransferase [Candidatus Pacebacteria bacterium]|nr:class I SAM-dependent methyltransferase [Candidatus Paceibacterota bacterium]